MNEIDSKGITQLLLSPLFLLNHILGVVAPGALLILLLAHKGNALLLSAWINPIFGYKTKVAIFLLLAYVFGSMLRLPLHVLAALIRPFVPKAIADPNNVLKNQPPEIQKAIGGAITDGVLVARPALMDRLSILQTDTAFHIGTGSALLVASFVPGDGSLRWLEGLLGLTMCLAGFQKAKHHADEAIKAVGIGLVDVLGGMTPHQVILAKAFIKALGLSEPEIPQTTAPGPSSQAPTLRNPL